MLIGSMIIVSVFSIVALFMWYMATQAFIDALKSHKEGNINGAKGDVEAFWYSLFFAIILTLLVGGSFMLMGYYNII